MALWTFETPPSPTVTAMIRNDNWNLTTETRVLYSLYVLEHNLLILSCLASYPVLWYDQLDQVMPSQTMQYNSQNEDYQIFSHHILENVNSANEYKTTIMFIDFGISDSEQYTCKSIGSYEEFANTIVSLYLRSRPNSRISLGIMQGGFYQIWLPVTFRTGYTHNVQFSIVHSIPNDDAYIQSEVKTPHINQTWKIKRETLFRNVGRTTVSMQVQEEDTGVYTIVLTDPGARNDGKDVVIETSFVLATSRLADQKIRRNGNITLIYLGTGVSRQLRGFLGHRDLSQFTSLTVWELVPERNTTNCGVRLVPPSETVETCGILGISLVKDTFPNDMDVFVKIDITVVRPCKVTLNWGTDRSTIYVIAIDLELFGYFTVDDPDTFYNARVVTVPEGIKSGSKLEPGGTLTLRCLMPACEIGLLPSWCREDLRYQMPEEKTCIPLREDGNYFVEDTDIQYSSHHNTTDFTLAFDMTFKSLKPEYNGHWYCQYTDTKEGGTVNAAIQPFNLDVETALPFGTMRCYMGGLGYPMPSVDVSMSGLGTLYSSVTNVGEYDGKQAFSNLAEVISKLKNITGADHIGIVSTIRSPNDNIAVPAGITTILIFISVASYLGLLWSRHRDLAASFIELARLLKNPIDKIRLVNNVPLNDQVKYLPYHRKYEIDRQSFNIGERKLGSGEFGSVFKGEWRNEPGGVKTVAIKVPNDISNTNDHKALVDELRIMCNIRPHINVLGLVGAYTSELDKKQLYLLTEYCENGCLQDYLRENFMKFVGTVVNCTGQYIGAQGAVEMLLKYAYEAANGMKHLAAENIVHRDLALRNLLLSGNHIVKIADFGLSRIKKKQYYRKRISKDDNIPMFWMAIESLSNGEYTEKSDVWSFGVVMWEIFCCGRGILYPDHDPDAAFSGWLRQSEENRLGLPKISCDEVYQLMKNCWKANPNDRPNFNECERSLSRILEQKAPEKFQAIMLSLSDAWAGMWQNRDVNINTGAVVADLVLDHADVMEEGNVVNDDDANRNLPTMEDIAQDEPGSSMNGQNQFTMDNHHNDEEGVAIEMGIMNKEHDDTEKKPYVQADYTRV